MCDNLIRLLFLVLIFWSQEITGVYAKTETIAAFTNVNLVPMTAEVIIQNQIVIVKGSRIIAIGPSTHIDIPKDAFIINGSNAYLIPGLADMHMHTRPNWLSSDWPVPPFYLYLAFGVTSIRDFGPKGRSPDNVLHWRDGIKKGELIGPTIYTCGEQLRGSVDNPEEIVRIQKAKQFDFIKLYSYLSQDEFQRAVATAKKVGMYTAGHIPFQVGLEGVLSEGMDEIAHIEELFWEFVYFNRSLYFNNEQEWMSYVISETFQQYEPYLKSDTKTIETALNKKMAIVAQKVKAGSIPICTTLFLDEVIVEKLFEPETFLSKPENKYLPKDYLDAFKQGREKHQIQFFRGETFAQFKRRADLMLLSHLDKAGVPLILGTDAGTGWMGLVPGLSVHKELRVLTKNGLTPFEAIKTATVNAAVVVNNMIGQGDFGTIEVGKRADLLLVNGNPLEDIEVLSSPKGVMAAGRWYDKSTLQRMITPGIPVTGAIHHVYEAEKQSDTYIEILIGKNFPGKLPDAIKSINVFGPQGKLPIEKEDFTYTSGLRDFWIKIPGIPKRGTYRFEVDSYEDRGATFDYQYVIKKIPLADSSTFYPENNAELDSATPTFTWQAVKAKKPLFYRLEIYKNNGGRVYSTQRVKNMVSHTVPRGVLKSGKTYRWRIRIADSDDWLNIQNRSHSKWAFFHVH
jgi:hypothetical protein